MSAWGSVRPSRQGCCAILVAVTPADLSWPVRLLAKAAHRGPFPQRRL